MDHGAHTKRQNEMCTALYVLLAARGRRLVGGLAGPLERVGGALLIAAGARLALVRSE